MVRTRTVIRVIEVTASSELFFLRWPGRSRVEPCAQCNQLNCVAHVRIHVQLYEIAWLVAQLYEIEYTIAQSASAQRTNYGI